MNTKNKIEWLLVLQGWAMLWVVIGHAGPADTLEEFPLWARLVYEYAYSFHMPLFIAVSGFLFYLTRINNPKWTYIPMLKEKLVRFGIPFVFFTLFAMILKSLLSSLVVRPSSITFSEFFHAIIYPSEGPMCEFWFLAVIMWLFALYPIWKVALRNTYTIIITSILTIVLHFVVPVNEFLALSRTAQLCSFFWWGILAAKFYCLDSNNNLYVDLFDTKLFRTPYLALLSAFFLSLHIFSLYIEIPYLPSIFGISFSFFFCLLLYKYLPKIFGSFRDYTYQIYLMGLFVQEFVKVIRYKMDLPFEFAYVISIVAGLYVPVLVSLVVKKIYFKPLNLCLGLKV